MAGLGRKVFTAGDVLTAAQVQGFLQDQAVMVFAGTAARSSAIATPSEGMVAITTDTDELQYYNGSSWVAGLPFGAWTSYTPTLTNITLGTGGTTSFKYAQLGKVVVVRGNITLGTSGTVTGANTVTLPVTANSDYVVGVPMGDVIFTNNTNYYPGTVLTISTTTVRLLATNAAGTIAVASEPTSTSPFFWASGHKFLMTFTYEAA
jgi:hypothetical protein